RRLLAAHARLVSDRVPADVDDFSEIIYERLSFAQPNEALHNHLSSIAGRSCTTCFRSRPGQRR
ncbi:MAG: hypothetical protein ACKN9S_07025, partial [Pirellula sp.]